MDNLDKDKKVNSNIKLGYIPKKSTKITNSIRI